MKAKSVILPADEIPRQWYNILADIKMNPPLGPDGQPESVVEGRQPAAPRPGVLRGLGGAGAEADSRAPSGVGR